MPPLRNLREVRPVTAAARSTNFIEPARLSRSLPPVLDVNRFRPTRLTLSDDELRQQVATQIAKFGPIVTRNVQIDVRRGDVKLSGSIRCGYERSLIQQAVGRLAGISDLDNQIEVRTGEPAADFESGSSTGLRSRLWEMAAIAGILIAAAASLLLLFQSQSASAGDVRTGDSVSAGRMVPLETLRPAALVGPGGECPSTLCMSR